MLRNEGESWNDECSLQSHHLTQPLTHAGSVGATAYTMGNFWGGGGRGIGRSEHAGHLTGCGGRLWRERWLNGSDVGRLRGTAEVGDIGTGGLVTDTAGLTPTFQVRGQFHTAELTCFCFDWTWLAESGDFWYMTPCSECQRQKPVWLDGFLTPFLFIPVARVESSEWLRSPFFFKEAEIRSYHFNSDLFY